MPVLSPLHRDGHSPRCTGCQSLLFLLLTERFWRADLLQRCDCPPHKDFHRRWSHSIAELLDFLPAVPADLVVPWKCHRRPDLFPLEHPKSTLLDADISFSVLRAGCDQSVTLHCRDGRSGFFHRRKSAMMVIRHQPRRRNDQTLMISFSHHCRKGASETARSIFPDVVKQKGRWPPQAVMQTAMAAPSPYPSIPDAAETYAPKPE